jgi:YVTN family beta-propeller protein
MLTMKRAGAAVLVSLVCAMALVQSCGGDDEGAADTTPGGGDVAGGYDAGTPYDAGAWDAGTIPDAGGIADSGLPADASTISVTVQAQELPAGVAPAAIALSGDPQMVRVDPTAKYLYVADATAGKVHAMFKKSVENASAIDFPTPSDFSVNTVTGVVVVTGGNSGKLGLLDPANDNALTTIDVKEDPGEVKSRPALWDQANAEVFVLNPNGNSVLVVELTPDPPVVTEVPVGARPIAADFDKPNRKLIVVNAGGDSVSLVHRPDNAVQTVAVGAAPAAVRFSIVDGAAYVVNSAGNSVSKVDTAAGTVTATLQVGAAPAAIQMDSTKNILYVANSGDNTVTVIKQGQPFGSPIQVGTKPVAVAIDEGVPMIFTANNGDGSVSIIDYWKNFEVHNFPLTGTGAAKIAIDPDTGVLWILNEGNGTVTMVGGYKYGM